MDTLISHISPKSPVSEAYRTLRTNIQFSDLDKDLHTILFTSSMPGEESPHYRRGPEKTQHS